MFAEDAQSRSIAFLCVLVESWLRPSRSGGCRTYRPWAVCQVRLAARCILIVSPRRLMLSVDFKRGYTKLWPRRVQISARMRTNCITSRAPRTADYRDSMVRMGLHVIGSSILCRIQGCLKATKSSLCTLTERRKIWPRLLNLLRFSICL